MRKQMNLVGSLGLQIVFFLFASYIANGQGKTTILNFTAAANGCDTHLDWNTASETNVKDIQIERSSNGGKFVTVATVQASGGGHYAYSEDGLGTGRYEYRLKLNGKDGKFLNSQTAAVSLTCDRNVQIAPLRTTGFISISGGNVGNVIHVYDSAGRSVLKAEVTGPRTEMSLKSLAPGTYFIAVIEGDQILKQETITKE
ncbi:T9SS type A sorting domain-containing protein [Taibaiella soli]|uniref:Secretion system C-terminal sorting domain-containing protein n=1 Tax=Taibaiella soli TaxID=1649169 RepID=A0A2W2BEL0_9BACT|nr:T9SS type A sorting domain-containing protein [Taibaiella soli]PZF74689.1 hypothetical protein DN068_00380 [Taibaiella soli]